MIYRRADPGFVLPAVLGYIAAFMLIVVLAANALERARDTTQKLELQNRLVAAVDDLEAQAVYAFLTSTPVPGGVQLFRAPQSDATAILMGATPDPSAPASIAPVWRADDGELKFASSGIVGSARYRDVSGLVSLNSSDPLIVTRLLEQFDVSREQATGLAATLKDFIDDDSLRRPRGGEAADYRLRQKSPPANSPLRDIAELVDVLGWDEVPLAQTPAFIELVTVSLTAPEPRWIFSPPLLKGIQETLTENWRNDLDPLDIAAAAHNVPGARARLSLRVQDPASGRGRYRIIEVERQTTALVAPLSRSLVYETSYSANAPNDLELSEGQIVDPFGAESDE